MVEKTFGTLFMRGYLLAILGALSLSVAAQAATELHFDLNTINVVASPAITAGNAATYTGTVTVSMNSSPASFLEGMDIDNVPQTINGTLTAVSGTLNMTNGAISPSPSSLLNFTIKNADNSQHNYTGQFDELDTNAAFVEGDVNPSMLDSNNFAGVDVTQWANKPLDGTAIFSNFSGSTANLDVFLEVPEPGIGWVAAGVVGMAGIRRRKM